MTTVVVASPRFTAGGRVRDRHLSPQALLKSSILEETAGFVRSLRFQSWKHIGQCGTIGYCTYMFLGCFSSSWGRGWHCLYSAALLAFLGSAGGNGPPFDASLPPSLPPPQRTPPHQSFPGSTAGCFMCRVGLSSPIGVLGTELDITTEQKNRSPSAGTPRPTSPGVPSAPNRRWTRPSVVVRPSEL